MKTGSELDFTAYLNCIYINITTYMSKWSLQQQTNILLILIKMMLELLIFITIHLLVAS